MPLLCNILYNKAAVVFHAEIVARIYSMSIYVVHSTDHEVTIQKCNTVAQLSEKL